MLEGLDKIDWSQLKHAYGAASDVPGLIRSLLSDSKSERDEAIHNLFGNIYHQGTVYEATAFAIPFLIEVLSSPATSNKSSVAALLASIADGTGYLETHTSYGSGEVVWRRILAEKGETLESELVRERLLTDQVRSEAAKGLYLLTPFLFDNDPEVRMSVAEALGAFPEHRETHLRLLVEALSIEADWEVQEVISESMDRLNAN